MAIVQLMEFRCSRSKAKGDRADEVLKNSTAKLAITCIIPP
jgi:hypothetical protein